MLDFMFATPKRHILGWNGVFWRILPQNPSRALGCSELQEPPQKTKKLTRFWCAKSRMRENETPARIVTNFCTVPICIRPTIAYGFGRWGGGQILAFSVDLLHRPYNTLALIGRASVWLWAEIQRDIEVKYKGSHLMRHQYTLDFLI